MIAYDDLGKQFVGFLFHCEGGILEPPDPLSEKAVRNQLAGTGNRNNLFIRCDDCGVNMTFEENDPEQLDGEWCCPECGWTVQEDEPYDMLNAMNEAFEAMLPRTDFL